MQYIVVGADGKEYGPVDFATLGEWARSDRVRPTSRLREFDSGRVITADQVPGLFQPLAGPTTPPQQDWSQLPSYYRQPQTGRAVPGYTGGDWLTRSFIYSALAVVFFFVFRGLGVVWGIFAVIYAFRAHSSGNRAGMVAVAVSILALAAVIVGWALRLQTIGTGY